MFFSSDEPADIVKLVNAYPEFRYLYQDIMEFRREPKELMHMFSEALRIMDRNLEKYMVEEAQKEAEDTQRKLAEAKAALADTEAALADKEAALADKDAQIAELEAKLAALKDH
jgi:septal ring factor EnvC (AmiA/AmiB activator)